MKKAKVKRQKAKMRFASQPLRFNQGDDDSLQIAAQSFIGEQYKEATV
jgi:hypothetical protein